MDAQKFIIQFQDFLAPRLDTYEQALYLYVMRHSRLIGLDEVTIGFKSARTRMATGLGTRGSPMSENIAYEKLRSLQSKGCLKIIRTVHKGTVLKVLLPDEIPNVVTAEKMQTIIDLEDMDFFNAHENRILLLKREECRCFYTMQKLDETNFVVDHVVSRPLGNNSYRNCVAASREANNKKGAMAADDFFRKLFRDRYISEAELEAGLAKLVRLKEGSLRPPVNLAFAN